MRRIALYARVSTRDKDQNPDTQLLRLRDFVKAHPDWSITKEYIDTASALDLGHRIEWTRLLDDAAKHKFDAVLVFKLDRAFRSVKHLHDTLSFWEPLHISFLSTQEGFDTMTSTGRLLMNILGSLAEFELDLISERVTAGMERAKAQGVVIGRPAALRRPFVAAKWPEVQNKILAGEMGIREAARYLNVSPGWISKRVKAPSVHKGESLKSPVKPAPDGDDPPRS